MSILNVPVKEDLLLRTANHAQHASLSLAFIVEQALESYLAWAEFDRVIRQVHIANSHVPVDEAEIEITEAYKEVQELAHDSITTADNSTP